MCMSAVRHVCIDKLYVCDPYALVIPIPKRLGAGACAWEALPHSFAPSTQKVYHTYEPTVLTYLTTTVLTYAR